jgi:hypothetical protein
MPWDPFKPLILLDNVLTFYNFYGTIRKNTLLGCAQGGQQGSTACGQPRRLSRRCWPVRPQAGVPYHRWTRDFLSRGRTYSPRPCFTPCRNGQRCRCCYEVWCWRIEDNLFHRQSISTWRRRRLTTTCRSRHSQQRVTGDDNGRRTLQATP